jgi:membrane associated rhomboid family serine protease
MLFIVGINIVLSFLPGIAWAAHIGGLVIGAAVTAVFVKLSSPKLVAVRWGAIALVVGFLATFFY